MRNVLSYIEEKILEFGRGSIEDENDEKAFCKFISFVI